MAEQEVALKSGLKYTDLETGSGPAAVGGKAVTVHYTGTFPNGKKFDSSLDRNEPFRFRLGAGQVIKGWDEGVVGMRIGGKRRLFVPAALAYGKSGAGDVIPPGADLCFVVELLEVE
ncbi:MAG TPA: FKBP-type peptidyl-prolyl cis-trans isomerase [Elusimicrobiales bacterium]|nr:FKBP-type peptidyl-prolyl cis-trans isomerase [Elusimicrobiales bacterium]